MIEIPLQSMHRLAGAAGGGREQTKMSDGTTKFQRKATKERKISHLAHEVVPVAFCRTVEDA